MGDVPVIEMSGVPPTMRQLAARAEKQLAAAGWLKPGVLVDYHHVIGGPVTEARLHVTHEPYILAGHAAVVMLKEKAALVSVDSLTPAEQAEGLRG